MLQTGPHAPATHLAPESRTIGDMFSRRAKKSPSKPAIYEKRDGRWSAITWGTYYERARRVAQGLSDLGFERGDRLAILGPTQAPWGMYDLGAQLLGLVSFGIYPKQSVEQIRYLVEHSDAKAVLVADEDELEQVLVACEGLEGVVAIVPWEQALFDKHSKRDPRMTSPKELDREPIDEKRIDEIQQTIDPDDLAILVYTSGTTGPPKGAMISHKNITTLLGNQIEVLDIFDDDLTFSFLPMAHVAERVLAFYGRVNTGLTTAYATSIAHVLPELSEVRPTIFGSVPRIYEKAYAKIHSEIEKKSPLVQKIFAFAADVAREVSAYRLRDEPLPLGLQLKWALCDKVVYTKVRDAFGGRVRYSVTGAAPIATSILEFFWGAGIPVFEVYGMTEATVVTHANRPGQVKLGTVGRLMSALEQKIADDGEILIKGPYVFMGYYKNDGASAETVIDGWLHTGDIGSIDSDGFLRITDRKKHLIITAGGKNLSPANIENAVKNQDPLISQVHAHGDQRPYVSALVAPSPIETLEFGVGLGLITEAEVVERTKELMANPSGRSDALNEATGKVVKHVDYQRRVREAVARGNEELSHVEKVKRFTILGRDFSQEHGELTPTMKLKRKSVEQKFSDLFERVYEEKGFALEPM
jgi:long-chain acyl-CoA synthetase